MAETNKPLRYDLLEAQIEYLLTAPENQEAVRRVLTSLGVEVQP